MSASKKALLFGVDSFTGKYLKQAFEKNGVSVVGTTLSKNLSTYCDITNYNQCVQFIKTTNPDYVVNLSGISFVPFSDYKKIYEITHSSNNPDGVLLADYPLLDKLNLYFEITMLKEKNTFSELHCKIWEEISN